VIKLLLLSILNEQVEDETTRKYKKVTKNENIPIWKSFQNHLKPKLLNFRKYYN